MSIFRTGKIIITGARTMDQIEETYEFLNRILRAHAAGTLAAAGSAWEAWGAEERDPLRLCLYMVNHLVYVRESPL
jgi:hypothetical protein